MFVILNGVAGNSDYEQWEVLYKDVGYAGADTFRRIINKVKPGFPPPEIIQALEGSICGTGRHGGVRG